jgi:tetratricopeptide (TPR) repeat protein
MLRHPQSETLEGFLESLEVFEAGLVLHLLQCPECAARGLEMLEPPGAGRGMLALRRDLAEIDYSEVWRRIERKNLEAQARLDEERRSALPLLRELLEQSWEAAEELVRTRARFRSWVLADLLLQEGRTRPPAERVKMGSLVLALAERLESHPERAVEDLKAGAHCERAEGLRTQGELDGTEAELLTASGLLRKSLDSAERARLCHLLAALRRDQGRTDEALGLLTRAADLFEEVGDLPARGAVLVELGFLLLESADPQRALAAFDEATAFGPRNLTSALACRAARGLALCLAVEGRIDDALRSLVEARDLYRWGTGSPEGLALLSLEGRISLEVDRPEAASSLLQTAFHGFIRIGEPYEAVLAGVALARAILRTSRSRKTLRQLAHQLQPILDSPKLTEPVRAAVKRFVEEAAANGTANPARLKELNELLDRARGCPPLRLEEAGSGAGR